MSEQYLLSVQDLHTTFRTDSGEVQAVNGVSFNLNPGEILGIVGESGSGKSVTAYSVMQILADNGRIKSGHILYKGEDLTTWSEKQMSHFRGKCCSIVFQDPMTSLNPVFTIGNQLGEAIRLHTNRKGKEVRDRAIEMLELVGINEPEKRIKQYPFELSGGQMQRVAIASVLVMRPDVMILDEPTSQLDPEGSDEVFRAVETLTGSGITILMIEQKIEKLAAYCDRILLLHKGKQIAFDTPQKVFSMPDLNDYGIQAPAFTRICKAEQVTLADGTYPVTVKEAAEVLREKRLGAHEHANAEAGVQKAVGASAADT